MAMIVILRQFHARFVFLSVERLGPHKGHIHENVRKILLNSRSEKANDLAEVKNVRNCPKKV